VISDLGFKFRQRKIAFDLEHFKRSGVNGAKKRDFSRHNVRHPFLKNTILSRP